MAATSINDNISPAMVSGLDLPRFSVELVCVNTLSPYCTSLGKTNVFGADVSDDIGILEWSGVESGVLLRVQG